MHYLQIDQMAQADPSYFVSVGIVCTQAFDTSSYNLHCMNNHGRSPSLHYSYSVELQINLPDSFSMFSLGITFILQCNNTSNIGALPYLLAFSPPSCKLNKLRFGGENYRPRIKLRWFRKLQRLLCCEISRLHAS